MQRHLHGAVRRIDINSGDLIDQISFTFEDGTKVPYGGEGGDPQPPFELADHEFIRKITGRKGDSLDAVQIHTSSGRKSRAYGNLRGGRPFKLKAPVGKRIIGVERATRRCGVIKRLICEVTHGQVRKVCTRSGDLVDQISFVFEDGHKESYGWSGGGENEPFELEVGEFITKISGREGDSLDGIQFHTNTGRVSQFYGNPRGGLPFEKVAPEGKKIIGVTRTRGYCTKIESLLFWEPGEVETYDPSADAALFGADSSDDDVQEELEDVEAGDDQHTEAVLPSVPRPKKPFANVTPTLIADCIIFGLAVTFADVGSDVLAVVSYEDNQYMVFYGLGICFLVCPMTACWAKLYVEGNAQWYDLVLYLTQLKTVQEVYEALKKGKKGFNLLFINICEVCFESFPQSTLATYALLIGMKLTNGALGLPAQIVFEVSVVFSWASAGRFIAQMDEYDPQLQDFHQIEFTVRLVRIGFRSCEVAIRVLSIAFFAAVMRPQHAGAHDNVQVAVWILLALDYVVMYYLCSVVAGNNKNNYIYAAICVLCAPMHFLSMFRRILPRYYMLCVIELLLMILLVWQTRPKEVIEKVLQQDHVLVLAAKVSGGCYCACLLLNILLLIVLPEDKKWGSSSWLIIPAVRGDHDDYESIEE